MLIVPTLAIPSQSLQTQLGGQAVSLNVYQQAYGLYIDVYANGALVIAGVICENLNPIIRSTYFGFIGDFIFGDTQGLTDPVYTGLGSRYQLAYLEASDIAGLNIQSGES